VWWRADRSRGSSPIAVPLQTSRLRARMASPRLAWSTAYAAHARRRPVWEIAPTNVAALSAHDARGSSKQAVVEIGRAPVRVRWMTAGSTRG